MFSISLLAFNLLPIPPLDGFHVVERLLPARVTYSDGFRKFAQYGPMVLMVLVFLGNFGGIDVLGTVMDYISLPANLVIVFISTLIGALGGL
jgi:Zn-dependent protease